MQTASLPEKHGLTYDAFVFSYKHVAFQVKLTLCVYATMWLWHWMNVTCFATAAVWFGSDGMGTITWATAYLIHSLNDWLINLVWFAVELLCFGTFCCRLEQLLSAELLWQSHQRWKRFWLNTTTSSWLNNHVPMWMKCLVCFLIMICVECSQGKKELFSKLCWSQKKSRGSQVCGQVECVCWPSDLWVRHFEQQCSEMENKLLKGDLLWPCSSN